MNSSDRTFALLAGFARALSHQLRTPLSVISNELTYLATKLPADECTRALGRVQDISQCLREACKLEGSALQREELNLTEFIAKIIAKKNNLTKELIFKTGLAPDTKISADGARLELLLSLIPPLCALLAKNEHQKPIEISLTQANNSVQIDWTCQVEVNKQFPSSSFQSFNQLYSEVLNSDSIAPYLADAIVWAHAGTTVLGIDSKQTFQGRIQLATL